MTTPEHVVVIGNELRLRQTFRNLVGNAVWHTSPGTHVEVEVTDGNR
ncbi:hypothetical protein [Gordonia rhizosphera]|nr:hypothetical protein [Gordonia rhizosphera]